MPAPTTDAIEQPAFSAHGFVSDVPIDCSRGAEMRADNRRNGQPLGALLIFFHNNTLDVEIYKAPLYVQENASKNTRSDDHLALALEVTVEHRHPMTQSGRAAQFRALVQKGKALTSNYYSHLRRKGGALGHPHVAIDTALLDAAALIKNRAFTWSMDKLLFVA
ncbi:hypothetical protein BD779DRAFT_1685645 [Infundibulicybe gibba]|nr:hypothetical protein BD779DRAFT_1685645 [Infundibulicybe gibba]